MLDSKTYPMQIDYYKPNQMLENAEKEMQGIHNVDLFNNPKHQKLTEKWCAGKFGIGYENNIRECKVGVNESRYREDADFFLYTNNKCYPFQVVEVPKKGRKRGQEYKDIANGSLKLVPYTPEKGRISGPDWIHEHIEKKVKKLYAGSEFLNLLVYANFVAHQLEYETILVSVKPFEGKFASIWVISDLHLCSLFSSNELGNIPGWATI